MATDTDVRAVTVTATGSVYGARTRVKAIQYVASGAGSIVLKDGGSGGATNLSVAVATGSSIIYIPGDGILFDTSVYAATLTNISSLTVFYG